MDPINQRTISPKILMIAGGVLLVIILVFSLLTLSNNRKSNQVANNNNTDAIPTPSGPVPTFSPPENFVYKTVDSINFIPKEINGYTIDAVKLRSTASRLFPALQGKVLDDLINRNIFNWLALNEFYKTNDPSKVTTSYAVKKVNNFSTLQAEAQKMTKDYQSKTIRVDGFYLKLRFLGTLPGNLKKLRKTSAELQPLARQLIENYRNQATTKKEAVLDAFNKNNTVSLLNNREVSKKFTNSELFPPLVGHSDYYEMMRSLPVGQVSDIMTLRSKVNGSTDDQDYAFAVFYITKKTGTYLPLQVLANSYAENATLK